MPATLLSVTADYSPPSVIAYATVTGLSLTLTAGTAYYFEFSLLVSAAATTTGHTVSVTGPASPTYLRYSWTIPVTGTTVSMGGSSIYDHAVAVPATSASQTATAPVETRISGMIVPSADGTFACRVKPEVAAVMTVHRGSWGLVAS